MAGGYYKSFLCVGGPLSGRRYEAYGNVGFQVPSTNSPAGSAAEFDPDSRSTIVKVELTRYRSETFHTPQGEVRFWVPDGQTPLATITMLLESFGPYRAIKRFDSSVPPAIALLNDVKHDEREACARLVELIGQDWREAGHRQKSDAAQYLAQEIREKGRSDD